MPRYERDTYEPSDEVRIFDGSEEDEDGEGSRLPLVIVLALLVVVMFGGLVWMAYSYGVVHGRTEPRELAVAAAPGPARIAPASPGGATTPYKGFKIYEQPAPADDEADVTPPAAATPAPAEKPAPVEPAPTPAPVAVAPPKPAPKPVVVTPKPAPKVEAQATAPPAQLAPTPKVVPPPAPKPVPVKPVAAPASGGGVYVQIGAYKSQAIADSAWQSYKAKHAALLAGFDEDVQQVDLGEKGTWYRLRIKGFGSKDAAGAMCDRLKADGSSCILAR